MGRLWASGPAVLVLCNLFWAASIVTARLAAPLIPPAQFTAYRWLGALAILLPFAWPHLRRDWPALRARWWSPALLGLLGVVAYNSLVYHGVHDTTALNALLLQSATPLLVIVAAFVLFRERTTLVQVAAILLSVVGVVVIAAEGSLELLAQLRFNPGDGLVLGAVASYAVYSVVLRLRPAVHPLSLLAATVALGDLVLIPFAAAELLEGRFIVATPVSVACLAYAAVFPSFFAYMLYNRGVELVGAAAAGQYLHLMPAFGVLMAMALLGERLHPYHAAGIALIGAGLWLAGRGRPRVAAFPRDHDAPSVFQPQHLLREARRQRGLPEEDVPPLCLLDPDGDLVRHLQRSGRGRPCPGWACYHTTLTAFELEDGTAAGVVGCAVGAPFAVLVAEQLFASGCRALLSITSAGQVADLGAPPYVLLIDRALRDEGTSGHYMAPSPAIAAPGPALLDRMEAALRRSLPAGVALHRGAAWTTDAPYRETQAAIAHARQQGALAVEMEAAALYAFATRTSVPVLCVAHVTNTMGAQDGDFEKGEADGAVTALRIADAAAIAFGQGEPR